ncbi:MAG: peptidylprolyl isomerase [Rhodopseudomonas sp.]|nr:peptidylprolyl isomerase [Rhodopseudomonas sp.]
MLRGIHKASSTWLGKAVMAVVMGFLVISFAIWGIGDMFRGFGVNSVAKIGGTEISIEQYRQYYTEKLQELSQRLRRPISPDQARALGIDRQLLGQLIAETTLNEQARQLRLGLSDDSIAERIKSDPNFRGPDGKFSPSRFAEIIRQAGFTEQRYVAEQRNVMLRRQIAQTVSGELKVPQTTLAAINQFQNEKRAIDYVALTAAQTGTVPAPTPDDLNKYFDAHKVLFRAPEYRKATLLALTPAELAKPDAVSDADAKAYYDARKETYGTPEKRDLHQIVFPSPEEAAAAHDKIVKGMSFQDLAKERGMKSSDVDVGVVSKAQIIDPAVAKAAFELKPNEVSAPVKGTFGTVLLQVTKIEPGSQKTYADVAADIKRSLAESRAKTTIDNLRDKIEDERAAGSTLAETAKKLNLKAIMIDAVDRAGRSPDGKPVADLPKTPDVIGSVFASDVGVDNEPLRLPNDGILYYDVTGITPSRERKLDEVKDQVETRWRDDEIAKRLKAKTDKMVADLKAGATLIQISTDNNLKIETAVDLQRGKQAGAVPAPVIEAAFKTAKDAAAATDGVKPGERYVLVVTDVTDPKFDAASAQAKAMAAQMQNSYADDIIGQYIAQLENDIGVSINQTALNQVTGGSTGN